MDWLCDTNILLRSAQPTHPMYPEAVQATKALLTRGDRVCVLPQNITEFWSAATRPSDTANGLGMSIAEAHEEVRHITTLLTLFPETESIYSEWLRLVVRHLVCGVKVYDARLVAAMNVYGITSVLTFNADDFKRYPGIRAVLPQEVIAASK